MAKSTAPKPKKPAKAAAVDSAATVGPIAGTIEGEPASPAAPAPKGKKGKASDTILKTLDDQFGAIRETLLATTGDKKQPRQLRWALKSLDAAKDAALRHVQHNGS